MSAEGVRAAFRAQAGHCRALGSPFMGHLMSLCADRLDDTGPVGARILGWEGDPTPEADSVPLRVAGALHALKLSGRALGEVYPPAAPSDDALWDAVSDAFTCHEAEILDWLARAPQTNEVRRSAALIPVLHLLARAHDKPIDLIELGCSGGLNLRADRFRLHAAGTVLGPESGVTLAPEWRGTPPAPALPVIGRRSGNDLYPVDPTRAEGALRLLAYLWPDQADRVARTRAAIDIAKGEPATLHAGDAADALASLLADRRPGVTTLVFHTVAWQYFPADTARRAQALLDAAGAAATDDAPLARFGMEADGGRGAGLSLTLWPGGQTHALGRADFHGRWIDWTGLPGPD